MKIPNHQQQLDRSFYQQSTLDVARKLIGMALIRRVDQQWLGGWIVETEAYLADNDLASHSARGKTPSNAAMFEMPGTLYVYPIHAKYCMNAVTEQEGKGCAVLIRAIEPVWGISEMMAHRGTEGTKRLVSGPAMLCQALSIDRSDDGTDLIGDRAISIRRSRTHGTRSILALPRIGISKSRELPYRFVDQDSPFLSRPAR